jgi:hypothetical protein
MKAACGDDWPRLCLLWCGLELVEAFGGLEEGDAVAEEFSSGSSTAEMIWAGMKMEIWPTT